MQSQILNKRFVATLGRLGHRTDVGFNSPVGGAQNLRSAPTGAGGCFQHPRFEHWTTDFSGICVGTEGGKLSDCCHRTGFMLAG